MAQDSNTISFQDLKKVADEVTIATTTFEWNNLAIQVKHALPMDEVAICINAVVRACFDDETNEYVAAAKPFAIRSAVLHFYTNIDLPNEYAEQYSILYGNDLFDSILEYVDRRQYADILESIDTQIDYEIRTQMAAVSKDINTLVNYFDQMRTTMSSVMDNVSPDDFKTLVSKMGQLDVNGEQLVKLVLDSMSERREQLSDAAEE